MLDGRTGILVEEYDVAGMAAGMRRLLASPDDALQMGRAARAHIEKDYSQTDRLDKLKAILKQAIDEHKTARGNR